MKIKCYLVKLKELQEITDKCYKAFAYDGSEALIPKSQVFGGDLINGYWISFWILEKKDLQYSNKTIGWFNQQTLKIEKNFTKEVIVNVPEDKSNVFVTHDNSLFK